MSDRLTDAQFQGLKTILAAGGICSAKLHMGRKRAGTLNRVLMRNLMGLGLASAESPGPMGCPQHGLTASWQGRHDHVWTCTHIYQVTPKGIRAFNEEEGRRAFIQARLGERA